MEAHVKGKIYKLERSDNKYLNGWRISTVKNKITYCRHFKNKKIAMKYFVDFLDNLRKNNKNN